MELTVTNKYGIKIKKCCASCLHKRLNNEKTRNCTLGETNVNPKYLCPSWAMSVEPNLDNAGKGGGRIRKKEWFAFLDKSPHGDIEITEKEFNKKYGSRFITG